MTQTVKRPVLSAEMHFALLNDDAPHGDLTTDTLEIGALAGTMHFKARKDMTVAGLEDAAALLTLAGVDVNTFVQTGDQVTPETTLLEGMGTVSSLHRAWKVSQTFLEIWSGVATGARALVNAAREARSDAVVACTRKNVPGTKAMAAASVRAGGAVMHRLGLSETLLVFPEHRAFLSDSGLKPIAQKLKASAPEKKCVIEVLSVAEGIDAARAGFDVIQTEKFASEQVRELVHALTTCRPRPHVAAAGGINPSNVGDYVQAGADIVVSSWPYTARPADIAVTLAPENP